MQETVTTCDGCNQKIDVKNLPLEMIGCDLCRVCIRKLIEQQLEQITLRINCEGCGGTGKIRIIDEERTYAEASCGENRTQYKTIECEDCFHG